MNHTITILALTMSLGACLLEAPDEEELGLETAALELNDPVTLTFYSEAGFWGTHLIIKVFPSEADETQRLITRAMIENANLLDRISSVRLDCGSRGAQVMLFRAKNTAASVFSWTENSADRRLECDPGGVAEMNLHTDAPGLADKLGSGYLIAHARAAEIGFFSVPLLNQWNAELAEMDGATADGEPELRLGSSTGFRIRQDLVLDSWQCGEHDAELELLAHMFDDGHFNVIVASTYVDTGLGDSLFGCRTAMEHALDEAAVEAAHELADGLETLLQFAADDHPHYYFVPRNSLHDDFQVAGGGDAEAGDLPADL
jgi:hypothetical protein